jgi:hypothetical protein
VMAGCNASLKRPARQNTQMPQATGLIMMPQASNHHSSSVAYVGGIAAKHESVLARGTADARDRDLETEISMSRRQITSLAVDMVMACNIREQDCTLTSI